jgi:hypothetical protein
MLVSQEHKCKGCKRDFSEVAKGRLHVDHCHTSGKVRGLLCHNCNLALGLLKDKIEVLANLIVYLEESNKDN